MIPTHVQVSNNVRRVAWCSSKDNTDDVTGDDELVDDDDIDKCAR